MAKVQQPKKAPARRHVPGSDRGYRENLDAAVKRGPVTPKSPAVKIKPKREDG